MSNLRLVCGHLTETGRRSSNDDAVFFDADAGLYVVCDGTRGRFGGRTAAELAVHGIHVRLDEVRGSLAAADPRTAEQLVESMAAAAHMRIFAAVASDPTLAGMTTTYASVLHRGSELLVSHVGDTRVYLWRAGALQQLTVDHNLENYIKQNPSFRPKGKYSGKTLVRALGLKQTPPPVDHLQLEIKKDDQILISTDGLSDSLPEMTLGAVLDKQRIASIDEVVAALVRAALNHGSMDNISLILLHATDRIPEGPRTAVFELATTTGTQHIVLGWLVFLDDPHKGLVVSLEASTVVGADRGCKVVLTEDFISSRHAEILRTQHGYLLRDLGSTNGTFINNVKVVDPHGLVDGDRVRMGRTEMIFKCYAMQQ
jgi:serine/threonine protein phosphatase PrpC